MMTETYTYELLHNERQHRLIAEAEHSNLVRRVKRARRERANRVRAARRAAQPAVSVVVPAQRTEEREPARVA